MQDRLHRTMKVVIAIEFGRRLGLAQQASIEPAVPDMSNSKSGIGALALVGLFSPYFRVG